MLEIFSKNPEISLKRIITEDETWTFYYDPRTKRMSAECIFPRQVRPTVVRRGRSVKKSLLVVFFDYKGIFCRTTFIPTPGRKAMNSHFYITKCLMKLIKKIRQKRRKTGLRGLFLLQDNASCHTSAPTTKFLKKKKLATLSHPPYNPDLAPCDFFLFPKLREILKGRTFLNQKELNGAVTSALNQLSKNGFLFVFQQWLARLKKCIECNGDYIERFE
ncbi:hypothetical protein BV898_05967 [Hypsibius exemplaris]|uniref:Mariner Mos1 transposase n=1 Tax=Hypsibius exemplaris TaxID=2072580 RepID=A0A1W0WXW4_HYPEX|nr:hypothetical protein BV898_05967 [Hypsibius exemplaris]